MDWFGGVYISRIKKICDLGILYYTKKNEVGIHVSKSSIGDVLLLRNVCNGF